MAFRLPLRSLSRGILARRLAPVSTVNRDTFATLAEVIVCYFLIVCFKLFLAVGSFGVDNNAPINLKPAGGGEAGHGVGI